MLSLAFLLRPSAFSFAAYPTFFSYFYRKVISESSFYFLAKLFIFASVYDFLREASVSCDLLIKNSSYLLYEKMNVCFHEP